MSQPRICLIAAMGENGVIGHKNRLPWRLPADWAHFRRHSLGKPLIMGRKTAQSLGKPLAKRQNIVLTKSGFQQEGFLAVPTIEAALAAAENAPEIMVIGGEGVYRQFMPLASRILLTRIARAYEGDAFFPLDVMRAEEWEERVLSGGEAAKEDAPAFQFVEFLRAPSSKRA